MITDFLAPGKAIDEVVPLSIAKIGQHELDFDLTCNQLGSNPVSMTIKVEN